MTEMFCSSCGNKITKSDTFCFNCGAKVEAKKKVNESLYENPLNTETSYREEPSYTHSPRKRKRVKKAVAIPLIIIGVMLIPVIAMGTLSSIRFDLGSLDHSVELSGITNIDLDIYNDIGSITIYYDESISNSFESIVTVRGGLGADIGDAVNFEHTIVGDTAEISFFFENPIGNFFNMKSLTHNIEVYLNPLVTVDFDIEASTGSIALNAEDLDDVVIEDMLFSSSTGSVRVIIDEFNNATFGDVNLESSTGGVSFTLEDSTNTTIEDLTLDTSTGSVLVNLGEFATIIDSDISLSTSTGSVTLDYENIFTPIDFTWNLSTSTGSITLDIVQDFATIGNSTMEFNTNTSTGSITVNGQFSDNIGIEITAATSTGSITLPNGQDYYVSSDYDLKNSQYVFILSTSTGSITASL